MLNKSRLTKALDSAGKHSEQPIIELLGKGIYQAVTVLTNPKTGETYIDPEGRGRLAAYIPALGGNPEDPQFFDYASPFGGSGEGGNYGFFGVPNGDNVTILVFFADGGDINKGYWFAVAQEIPDVVAGGAASGEALDDGTGLGSGAFVGLSSAKETPPSIGDSYANKDNLANSNFNTNTAEQGIYTDNRRGLSTASPHRDANYETPQENKVTGIKTPGGSALTFDDGSVGDDGTIHPNQIRMTTGTGASVVLDGTNDFIYVINSSGTGWLEIGASGEVMVYAKGSMSIRTEKDFNVRADKNINLEAGDKINIHSKSNTLLNSDDQIHILSEGSSFLQSKGSLHMNVGQNMYATTGGIMHLNGPQASISQLIKREARDDMQDGENTQIQDSIIPKVITHEPYLRTAQTEAGTPNPHSEAGSIAPNPSSSGGASGAANQESITSNIPPGAVGQGTGVVTYGYEIGSAGKTRNKAIQAELMSILDTAAKASGVDAVITSGGQDIKGQGTRRTGSTRHDGGYAADVALYSNGNRLSVNKRADLAIIIAFCEAAKSAGAKSIGAGPGYMSGNTFHVDIALGVTTASSGANRWGAGGRLRNSPSWLTNIMI